MKDKDKTKEQLIEDNLKLQQRIGELEVRVIECKRTAEESGFFKYLSERKKAEKEVSEARDFLEKVIESSRDGIIITNEKGDIISVNAAVEQIYGLSKEELIGNHASMLSITDEKYRKDTRKRIHALFEKGFVNYETTHKTKQGKQIDVEGIMSMIKDDQGDFIAGVSIIRDISERKKAAEEIKEAKEFLENVFETSADGIMVTDAQGCITKVNKAIEKMLGYQAKELTGKYTTELGPRSEDKTTERSKTFEQLFEKGHVENWEAEFYRKDGSLCSTEINAALLKDREGNFSGILGAIRDITKRKKDEEERIRLSSAVEQAAETVLIMDSDGIIQYINPAAENIMGYKSEEIIGQNLFLTERGIYNKEFYQETRETIGKGNVWTGHITFKNKDGELCEFEQTISPIRDNSDNIINFVVIGHDITNELRLEKQLQQAQKMEALGTLAGGVAHDLNNILSGIVTYPELLLLNLPQDSPLRKPILTIQKSGQKAATIVQDMLTLARRGVSVTEVVNMNKIIFDYLSSPECEKLKSFHLDVRIKINLEKDLFNILGSPVHLSKTVMNLVSNAAEAMSSGGEIVISTVKRHVDKQVKGYDAVEKGDYVVLTVSDTGSGISKEDLERIFEPFYTKKVMGRSGTGLGMAVIWGTVKDHKGYIDVQSTEGTGTTFTLYFPASGKELAMDKSRLSIEDYKGKGESILVVDDVKEQREIGSKILRELNYNVEVVASGEEAIKYLKNNTADLLFLDMIMDPGIDGLETYKKILEIHPNQKAIIASGFSETDRVREAQKLGAGSYIRKPYTLEKIGLAVKAELEKQS